MANVYMNAIFITRVVLSLFAVCSPLLTMAAIAKDEAIVQLSDVPNEAQAGVRIWSAIERAAKRELKNGKGEAEVSRLRLIAESEFATFLSVPEQEILPSMKYFVSRFGKHGADADMGWILACPWLTVPYHTSREVMKDELNPTAPKIYLAFDRAFVERALVDQSFRFRHHRAVVWSRAVFGDERYHDGRATNMQFFVLESQFKGNDVRDYWWRARQLLVYVHAMSKDDLIANKSPSQLHEALVAFIDWGDQLEWSMKLSPDGLHWEWSGTNVATPSSTQRKVILPRLKLPQSPFTEWMEAPVSHIWLDRSQLTSTAEDLSN